MRNTRTYNISTQYAISISTVLFTAAICFIFKEVIGYRIVALLLLMTVSIIATLFDIIPVLLASILSALILNFFFIPPYFTFHINNSDDVLLFSMYFLIAVVNAVLTFKIRTEQKKTRDKEEKENTIKLYDNLLNSLSHELRTPISTIIGAIDTLKESKEKLSTENQNELLDQIDIASVRLNNQVENLLSMSRLETGLLKLNLAWCDINELIHLSIQKINETIHNKTILFTSNDTLPICKIDSGLIEQVILNILSNAIIYTPSNTKIIIAASIENNYLHLIISDTGIGIPEDYLDKIFNKFYRLPHTQAGGTGLGLSIVKGFIEAHKGTIKAKNILPQGLEFSIMIPVETSYINNLNNE